MDVNRIAMKGCECVVDVNRIAMSECVVDVNRIAMKG